MKLEQQLYDSSRISVEDRNYIVAGDLEYLSVSPLYSGASINVGPGFGGGDFLNEKKSGSGSLKSAFPNYDFSKPFGSKPLELPKFDFLTPKVSSGPIRIGGSKPLKFPEIDFSKLVEKYSTNLNLPKVWSKPLYGTPSKIFIPESTTPLLRYDPADENHDHGHLHIGNNSALKGIKGEEARETFVEAWFRTHGLK